MTNKERYRLGMSECEIVARSQARGDRAGESETPGLERGVTVRVTLY